MRKTPKLKMLKIEKGWLITWEFHHAYILGVIQDRTPKKHFWSDKDGNI